MRLLLLRHAQTVSNVSGALDTAFPGADLTPLGRAQASAAADVLGTQPVDGIFCSSLVRTQQTAAPIAAALGVEVTVLDGLREISAGDYEMRTDDDARTGFMQTVAGWIFGDLTQPMPGGETGEQFLARYDDAIAQVVQSGAERALVVSHGAAIRTWVGARVVDDGSDTWADHAMAPLHNTGSIELERGEDGWRIVAWVNEPLGGEVLDDPDAADPTARLD